MPTRCASAVEWLLRSGRESGAVDALVERVVQLAGSAPETSRFAVEYATVRSLADSYPGDPGIVLSLLLNHVTLHAGEALYLPAGNIHAYLSGLGIELMAASDNVLRGGLTPKHIDVEELLDVLDFTPVDEPLLAPETPSAGVRVFRPDVPDFVLYDIDASRGARRPRFRSPGAAIALCTAGTRDHRRGRVIRHHRARRVRLRDSRRGDAGRHRSRQALPGDGRGVVARSSSRPPSASPTSDARSSFAASSSDRAREYVAVRWSLSRYTR